MCQKEARGAEENLGLKLMDLGLNQAPLCCSMAPGALPCCPGLWNDDDNIDIKRAAGLKE